MEHSQDVRQLIVNSRPLLTTVSNLWTKNHKYIGYCHLIKVSDGLHDIETISKRKADNLLEKDLIRISKQLTKLLGDVQLTQNQFDALVSLVYDIGIQAYRASELPKLFKEGKLTEAVGMFRRWNKYEKNPKYQLIIARQKEIQLFNDGWFKRTRKKKR
mgnify:CR=1 FL=1